MPGIVRPTTDLHNTPRVLGDHQSDFRYVMDTGSTPYGSIQRDTGLDEDLSNVFQSQTNAEGELEYMCTECHRFFPYEQLTMLTSHTGYVCSHCLPGLLKIINRREHRDEEILKLQLESYRQDQAISRRLFKDTDTGFFIYLAGVAAIAIGLIIASGGGLL